ncbi:MAG TPA: OmpA family protein [Anaeromyxobacteraceae bacterium]
MRSLLLPLCAPLVAAACAHSAPAPAATAPTAAAAPPAEKVHVEKKAEPRACASDDQCGPTQLCQQRVCTDITSALEACQEVRVHFAFDKADLEASELPMLRRMSRCLGADRGVHVLIQGNADERGTVEYNLALGDRRAAAVDRYLEGLGVPATQLATVSYGKELPLCTVHDEACWAQNRRATVEPNGKARDLSALERRDEARERHRVAHTERARPAHGQAAVEAPAKEQAEGAVEK